MRNLASGQGFYVILVTPGQGIALRYMNYTTQGKGMAIASSHETSLAWGNVQVAFHKKVPSSSK